MVGRLRDGLPRLTFHFLRLNSLLWLDDYSFSLGVLTLLVDLEYCLFYSDTDSTLMLWQQRSR